MKRNIEFTPELMTYIKQIYGNKADLLNDKTLKNLYLTWQLNPEFFKNAAALKNLRQVNQQPTRLASLVSRPTNLTIRTSEIADDDLSAINSFNDAFRIARQRNLKQFKWKSTKANPSGIFAVEIGEVKENPKDDNGSSGNLGVMIANNNKLRELLAATLKLQDTTDENQKPQDNINENQKAQNNSEEILNNISPGSYSENFFDYNLIDPSQLNTALGSKGSRNALVSKNPVSNSLNTISHTLASINRYRQLNTMSNVDFGIGKGLAQIGKYIWDKFTDSTQTNPNRNKQINKFGMYQQGGQMNSLQLEMQKKFIQFLVLDASKQGIQIQSEQDLQKYIQALGEEGLKAKLQEFMQTLQGGVMARLGAKLEYVKRLKGICPEGYELKYFKQGGQVCKVCLKGENINKNDTIHVNDGKKKVIYDLTGKHKKYPKLTPDKYRKLPVNKQTDVDLKDLARKDKCGAKLKKKKK